MNREFGSEREFASQQQDAIEANEKAGFVTELADTAAQTSEYLDRQSADSQPLTPSMKKSFQKALSVMGLGLSLTPGAVWAESKEQSSHKPHGGLSVSGEVVVEHGTPRPAVQLDTRQPVLGKNLKLSSKLVFEKAAFVPSGNSEQAAEQSEKKPAGLHEVEAGVAIPLLEKKAFQLNLENQLRKNPEGIAWLAGVEGEYALPKHAGELSFLIGRYTDLQHGHAPAGNAKLQLGYKTHLKDLLGFLPRKAIEVKFDAAGRDKGMVVFGFEIFNK